MSLKLLSLHSDPVQTLLAASLWSVAFDTLCGFSDISSFKSIIAVICPDCSSVRSGFSFPAFCVFALSLFCDFSERSGSDIRSDFSALTAFADFLDRFALPVFSAGSAFPDSSASPAFSGRFSLPGFLCILSFPDHFCLPGCLCISSLPGRFRLPGFSCLTAGFRRF